MFNCYIGLPGSGKSSHACHVAKKWLRKGYKVYSNFPIKGCYLYDITDIGQYQIENCILILDEAGIDISNRSYKDKSQSKVVSLQARKWWKLYRHYHVHAIYVYSQALDYDITLRRLADNIHIIKKGIFGFSNVYKLRQNWGVDAEGQPIIQYTVPLLFLPFFRPVTYKMFDSFEAPQLAEKQFEYVPIDVK